ncbi:MAG: hypothetical protein AAB472_00415 [Patescibacteria group bacterium]
MFETPFKKSVPTEEAPAPWEPSNTELAVMCQLTGTDVHATLPEIRQALRKSIEMDKQHWENAEGKSAFDGLARTFPDNATVIEWASRED